MRRALTLISTLIGLGAAQAAQLPEAYLGSWTSGDMGEVEVTI